MFNPIGIIDSVVNIYGWLIFVRVIFSWIPLPRNQFVETIYGFIYDITEPVLGWFRKILPPAVTGAAGLDLSPLIAWFALRLAYSLIRPLIAALFSF